MRIGRHSHIIGPKGEFDDFSNFIPRQERVNLASTELYNDVASLGLNAYPFKGQMAVSQDLTGPVYWKTNQLRGSTFLQTQLSSLFVDPSGAESVWPESSTTQNAGMSIDFILQRYASGQSLPVQNRNMRADSDYMSDQDMKKVRVISDVFEAQQYIRDVKAREAAQKEAKADAPSSSGSGSADQEPSAPPSSTTD